jgi:hypothetical protein
MKSSRMIVEVRDATRPRIDAAAYCRWRAGVACVSTPTIAAHDPRQDCFMMEGDQGELRNFPHPISPALQARIDAITDADLRAHILFILADPEPRRSTDEQIVESMVLSHERAMELREERGLPSPSLWHPWRDDEVLAFIEHVRHALPVDHAELVRAAQEKTDAEEALMARVRALGEQWRPGLETLDYLFLFDRMQLHLRIAPCLLSRVSALPEASLRAHILRVLGRSVGFPVTHEQIVDEMVREHVSTCVAVARRYPWRKAEMLEFIAYLQQEIPSEFEAFCKCEQERQETDYDLLGKIIDLADAWRPDVDSMDRLALAFCVQAHVGRV